MTNTTWEMIDDPEAVGWSTEKLQTAYAYSQNIQTAAVMIIYDGEVLHYGVVALVQVHRDVRGDPYGIGEGVVVEPRVVGT